MEEIKVSVVIPTYNRQKCLIDLLKCLLIQDYVNYEILVIDQSELLTEEKKNIIISNSDKIKYYHIKDRGRSLAKNYGIVFSTGEIILFCDDDIIVPRNFISTHVQTFDDSQIGAVSCRLVEDGQPSVSIDMPLRTTFYGRLINKPYSTTSALVTSLNGGNMSFRKDVLDKVGFFEEFFEGTSMVEEPDIAYRIVKSGFKLFFNASITVFHYPQHNGNIAEMKGKRANWFYYYFFNLSIFYLKYKRYWNMLFVFCYCITLSFKHAFQYQLSFKDYKRMVLGFFYGMQNGIKISKLSAGEKYYTPVRHVKKPYAFLKSVDLT